MPEESGQGVPRLFLVGALHRGPARKPACPQGPSMPTGELIPCEEGTDMPVRPQASQRVSRKVSLELSPFSLTEHPLGWQGKVH